MNRLACPSSWLLPVLLALPMAAQDMIGVKFSGEVLRLNSTTGAVTLLASGQLGKNCLANTSDNRLWTTVRTGTSLATFQFFLAVINPFTGAETLPFGNTNVGDIRALAASPTGQLFGIRDVGGPDELVGINLQTGAVFVIGPTGMNSIQALDSTTAGMRGWDLNAGLVIVSSQTGAATDPFPGSLDPAGVQWMATNPATGQEFVGSSTLQTVSTLTGVVGQIISISGSPDLRGVEFTTSRQQQIGTGCAATNGTPACFVTGSFGPGLPLIVQSTNHAASAVGIQIVGFSESLHAGVPLPINLDAVFGTSGCFLRVSGDFTMLGLTSGTGNLFVTLNLPPSIAFQQFYLQHAVLEPVPGGISFSNGLRVRPGM